MTQNEKLYIITREDLSHGDQAVQSCHAFRQFVFEHSEVETAWFHQSNYLALLSTKNEDQLMAIYTKAMMKGIRCSCFREPDMNDALTAIVLEPGKVSKKLCSQLPLAMK